MDTSAIQDALQQLADAMKAKGHEKATASLEIRLLGSHCCTVNVSTGGVNAFKRSYGTSYNFDFAYGSTPEEAIEKAFDLLEDMTCAVDPALAPDFAGPLVLASAS